MTDQRNVAHDKKVAHDKRAHGQAVVDNAATAPQPGKKPHLIDADTEPSNTVASKMYKQGEEPRVHRDDSDKNKNATEGDSAH